MFKLKRSILWFLPLGILVVALSACSGGANAEPTQDPNVVFTQVAETVMVSMTQTAEAAPPTATPEPTATQIPTAIPTATTDPSQVTPVATTIVVQPSSPSGIPTATTQRYGDGAKWNTQSPADGTVLEKSQNFAFHVCLGNIGSTDWTTKYYLQYVSGQQLWWNTTTFNLGDTVKPGDKWCFDLPSIAPSKAGEYTTRWYLKNATGESFFEVYFHYYVGQ
ncbi:MAG: hypothetical protein GYA18_10360 [Chloroflexi bacterium]|nr:hypothetical protein [Chloroflexota bacterium]